MNFTCTHVPLDDSFGLYNVFRFPFGKAKCRTVRDEPIYFLKHTIVFHFIRITSFHTSKYHSLQVATITAQIRAKVEVEGIARRGHIDTFFQKKDEEIRVLLFLMDCVYISLRSKYN